MNLPQTIDQPLSERAEEHRRPVASPPPARSFRVAVAGAYRYPTDVQQLLQKRLRFVGLVIASLFGLFTVLNTVTALQGIARFLNSWWRGGLFSLNVLIFLTSATVTAVLWARRALPLGRLRTLEAALFLPVILDCGVFLANRLLALDGLELPAGKPVPYLFFVASGESIFYVVLIVSYSTFIPSTRRRCAAMVGIIALTPLTITLWACLTREPVARNLLWFFLPMGTWLAVAVAIAVYGTHRMEALRRGLSEARKLGQYYLGQRLGAGGMGEVYLAEHALLRRPCAIKLIRPERAGEPNNLLRFEREVQTTATLTHPNAVQIYDYGRAEDGTFYYAMEYLPGLTLEQLVKEYGPLPPARAVHFLRQVCGALREAHAVGFIHRDIKPSNIMACERGGMHDVAKLLDFGLVIPLGKSPGSEKLTQEGAIAGTPAYMSPEQVSGQEEIDARSDIYGIGALAYFLLTGQPPFAGRSGVKVLAAHLYEPPPPLTTHRPEVPTGLERVVLKCLAKVPTDRYPNVRSLDAALAESNTVRQWTEEDAAEWWQLQSGSEARTGSSQGHEEAGRTSGCT
jgi:serine/threonine-protein kinase